MQGNDNFEMCIGILPRREKSAAALHVLKYGLVTTKVAPVMGLVPWINKNVDFKKTLVLIEDPNSVRINFAAYDEMESLLDQRVKYKIWEKRRSLRIPDKVDSADVKASVIRWMQKAQDLGEEKAIANILCSMLDRAKAKYLRVSVDKILDMSDVQSAKLKRGLYKGMSIGMLEENFHQRITSQLARDAAGLVVSHSSRDLSLMYEDGKPSSYPSASNSNYYLLSRKSNG